MSDETKKYITLENLQYFLEKFKYALAHNGDEVEEEETEKEGEQ